MKLSNHNNQFIRPRICNEHLDQPEVSVWRRLEEHVGQSAGNALRDAANIDVVLWPQRGEITMRAALTCLNFQSGGDFPRLRAAPAVRRRAPWWLCLAVVDAGEGPRWAAKPRVDYAWVWLKKNPPTRLSWYIRIKKMLDFNVSTSAGRCCSQPSPPPLSD